MLSTSSGLSKCNTVSALQPINPLLSFDAPPKYSFSISDKYGAERYSQSVVVYAADGDGQIIKTQTLSSPAQIFTSGKQFMADNSKRESARWIEALDRLIKWGWVKAVGYKGEIFELTKTGYSKADWLKAGMGIDTSKNPLDELKEFED